jgi:hypothetical protein
LGQPQIQSTWNTLHPVRIYLLGYAPRYAPQHGVHGHVWGGGRANHRPGLHPQSGHLGGLISRLAIPILLLRMGALAGWEVVEPSRSLWNYGEKTAFCVHGLTCSFKVEPGVVWLASAVLGLDRVYFPFLPTPTRHTLTLCAPHANPLLPS